MDLRGTTERRMNRSVVVLAAIVFCCLSLFPPAVKAAEWSEPFHVSEGESANGPLLDFQPNGDSTMAWIRQAGSIRIADRQAGGEFELVDEIVPGPARFFKTADMASNAVGTSVLAFTSSGGPSNRLLLSIRSPGEHFGDPLMVAASDSTFADPEVAVGPDGTIIVTWIINKNPALNLTPENGGSGLFAWIKGPGDESGSLVRLGADVYQDSFSDFLDSDSLAMGPDGTATVVWETAGAGGTKAFKTRTRLPQGEFGPVEEINVGSNPFTFPRLVVDNSGRSSVYWECGGVCYADRPSNGPWGPVQALTFGQDAYSLSVTSTPDGTTLAVWSSRETTSDGTNARIVATRRDPGGSFPSPQVISGSDIDAVMPWAGISPNGEATVIWEKSSGYPDILRGSVSDSAGNFAPPTTVVQTSVVFPGFFLAAGGGEATAFWLSTKGNSTSVGFANRTATGFGPPSKVSDTPGAARNPKVGFISSNALTIWEQEGSGVSTLEQSTHQINDFIYSSGFSLDFRATDPDLSTSDQYYRGAAVWARHEAGNFVVQASTNSNEYLTRGFTISNYLPVNPEPKVAVGPQKISTAAWIGQDLNYRGIPMMHPTIQTADFTRAGPVEGATYVSDLGEVVGDPDVASGRKNGTTAIVWTGGANGDDIRAAVRRPGDPYFTSTTVAGGGTNESPQVAVGDLGQIVVTWTKRGSPDRVQVAISRSGYGFGPVMDVPRPGGIGAMDPRLGIRSDGRYWIAWRGSDGTVQVSTGTDQPDVSRSISGTSIAGSAPAISVSPGGHTLIAWRADDDSIWATTGTQSGSFGSPLVVATGAANGTQPEVAASYWGHSEIVWVDADGSVNAVEKSESPEDCPDLSKLTFGGIQSHKRRLPYRLMISTSSSGLLTVASSRALKQVTARSSGNATTGVPLRLRAGAASKLKRKGKLEVTASVRFQTDSFCAPVTRNFKLKLKR